MKLIRSSKCSLKFATKHKLNELKTILAEYGKVCNAFIDYFWNNGTPPKSQLLKDIVAARNILTRFLTGLYGARYKPYETIFNFS